MNTSNKPIDFSPIFNRQLKQAPLPIKMALREAVAALWL